MNFIQKQLKKLKKAYREQRIWRKAVTFLSAVAVFCTTYALIIPAITWEKQLVCEIEEHVHTEDCYKEVLTDGKSVRVLSCGKEEHVHSAECFDAPVSGNDRFICSMEEHVHTAACYDENWFLQCSIPEHVHSYECLKEPVTITCAELEDRYVMTMQKNELVPEGFRWQWQRSQDGRDLWENIENASGDCLEVMKEDLPDNQWIRVQGTGPAPETKEAASCPENAEEEETAEENNGSVLSEEVEAEPAAQATAEAAEAGEATSELAKVNEAAEPDGEKEEVIVPAEAGDDAVMLAATSEDEAEEETAEMNEAVNEPTEGAEAAAGSEPSEESTAAESAEETSLVEAEVAVSVDAAGITGEEAEAAETDEEAKQVSDHAIETEEQVEIVSAGILLGAAPVYWEKVEDTLTEGTYLVVSQDGTSNDLYAYTLSVGRSTQDVVSTKLIRSGDGPKYMITTEDGSAVPDLCRWTVSRYGTGSEWDFVNIGDPQYYIDITRPYSRFYNNLINDEFTGGVPDWHTTVNKETSGWSLQRKTNATSTWYYAIGNGKAVEFGNTTTQRNRASYSLYRLLEQGTRKDTDSYEVDVFFVDQNNAVTKKTVTISKEYTQEDPLTIADIMQMSKVFGTVESASYRQKSGGTPVSGVKDLSLSGDSLRIGLTSPKAPVLVNDSDPRALYITYTKPDVTGTVISGYGDNTTFTVAVYQMEKGFPETAEYVKTVAIRGTVGTSVDSIIKGVSLGGTFDSAFYGTSTVPDFTGVTSLSVRSRSGTYTRYLYLNNNRGPNGSDDTKALYVQYTISGDTHKQTDGSYKVNVYIQPEGGTASYKGEVTATQTVPWSASLASNYLPKGATVSKVEYADPSGKKTGAETLQRLAVNSKGQLEAYHSDPGKDSPLVVWRNDDVRRVLIIYNTYGTRKTDDGFNVDAYVKSNTGNYGDPTPLQMEDGVEWNRDVLAGRLIPVGAKITEVTYRDTRAPEKSVRIENVQWLKVSGDKLYVKSADAGDAVEISESDYRALYITYLPKQNPIGGTEYTDDTFRIDVYVIKEGESGSQFAGVTTVPASYTSTNTRKMEDVLAEMYIDGKFVSAEYKAAGQTTVSNVTGMYQGRWYNNTYLYFTKKTGGPERAQGTSRNSRALYITYAPYGGTKKTGEDSYQIDVFVKEESAAQFAEVPGYAINVSSTVSKSVSSIYSDLTSILKAELTPVSAYYRESDQSVEGLKQVVGFTVDEDGKLLVQSAGSVETVTGDNKRSLFLIYKKTADITPHHYPAFKVPSGEKIEDYTYEEHEVTAYSDPSTSDIERLFRNTGVKFDTYGSGYETNNGRVRMDKSVIYGADDYGAFPVYEPNTFSVTLSALGQAYDIKGNLEIEKTPMDVIFILDTSQSMVNRDTGHTERRIDSAVKALNSAMGKVFDLGWNEDGTNANRVGLVTFNRTAAEVMPLGAYKPSGSSKTYLTYDSGSGSYGAVKTASGMTKDGKAFSQRSSSLNLYTATQAGVAAGSDLLLNNDDLTFSGQVYLEYRDGSVSEEPVRYTLKRTPVVILLTDGDPSCYYSEPEYIANVPYSDASKGHEDGQSSKVAGQYVMRTEKAYIDMIRDHYGVDPLYFTLGFGDFDSSQANIRFKAAVLNPSKENIEAVMKDTGNAYSKQLAGDISADFAADNYCFDCVTRCWLEGATSGEDMAEILKSCISNTSSLELNGILLKGAAGVEIDDPIGNGMEVKGTPVLVMGYEQPEVKVTLEESSDSNYTYKTYYYEFDYLDPYAGYTISSHKGEETVLRAVLRTEKETGLQTMNWAMGDTILPVYRHVVEYIGETEQQTDSWYYEQLPMRLIYKVGLTEEAEEAAMTAPGESVFYVNRWLDPKTENEKRAVSEYIPSSYNPYYMEKNEGKPGFYPAAEVEKSSNPSGTEEDRSWWTTKLNECPYFDYHGNNGKLVIQPAKPGIEIPVKLLWEGGTAGAESVKAGIYKVTDGKYVPVKDAAGLPLVEVLNEKNNWSGSFTVKAEDGPYYIMQITEVPEYFVKYEKTNGGIADVIEVDGKVAALAAELDGDAYKPIPITIIDYTHHAGPLLPSTGGIPTEIIYILGVMLIAGALIYALWDNRKTKRNIEREKRK